MWAGDRLSRGNSEQSFGCTRHAKPGWSLGWSHCASVTQILRTVAEKRLLGEGFPVRELEQIYAASRVSKTAVPESAGDCTLVESLRFRGESYCPESELARAPSAVRTVILPAAL